MTCVRGISFAWCAPSGDELGFVCARYRNYICTYMGNVIVLFKMPCRVYVVLIFSAARIIILYGLGVGKYLG